MSKDDGFARGNIAEGEAQNCRSRDDGASWILFKREDGFTRSSNGRIGPGDRRDFVSGQQVGIQFYRAALRGKQLPASCAARVSARVDIKVKARWIAYDRLCVGWRHGDRPRREGYGSAGRRQSRHGGQTGVNENGAGTAGGSFINMREVVGVTGWNIV